MDWSLLLSSRWSHSPSSFDPLLVMSCAPLLEEMRSYFLKFQIFCPAISPQTTMNFEISFCKLHKNSLSDRLLEGKAITPWDVLGENNAVSQKVSFQFLTEDIRFFTLALYGLANITLQIPQEQSKRKAFWGESLNLSYELTDTNLFFKKLLSTF